MTFDESLSWLYGSQQFGIKLGLENIRRLLHALGNPQDRVAILHVAGTNGKGSVCAMLDAILCASGRRTGLYTSPHLVDFRERVRVDGRKIDPGAVADGLTRIRALSEGWDHSPTFFEISTALALWFFAREGSEFVVLETGMGGRLDATNAVTPRVSVLTPIAMDHAEWLGDTLAAIAGEKAGIIKPGVPVVSAAQEPEVERVFRDRAALQKAPIRFVETPLGDVEVALAGDFQKLNAALAAAALEAAGVLVPAGVLGRGLKTVRWPGRFQRVGDTLVLDGGHNPHAARQLLTLWRETFGEERATVIFGALTDKDFPAMLDILSPLAKEFFLVPVSNPRTATLDELAAHCPLPHRRMDSVGAALAATSGRTLVTGSLFLVGEAMAVLGIEP